MNQSDKLTIAKGARDLIAHFVQLDSGRIRKGRTRQRRRP